MAYRQRREIQAQARENEAQAREIERLRAALNLLTDDSVALL